MRPKLKDIVPQNRTKINKNEKFLARPAGLEPATHRLEICCSIQLSHGRVRHIIYK